MAARRYVREAESPHAIAEASDKLNPPLNAYILTQFALLFLSSNVLAGHRLKSKVLEFFMSLDVSAYADNQDTVSRLVLVQRIGTAMLREGAKSKAALVYRLSEHTDYGADHVEFIETYKAGEGFHVDGDLIDCELSDENIAYLDGWVSTRLRFSHLYAYTPVLRQIATMIEAGDVGDIPVFNDTVLTHLEKLVTRGRQAKAILKNESGDFNTGDSSFAAALRATHEAKNRPQNKIRTGSRWMDELLCGGYEGGRVYVHFGRSGELLAAPRGNPRVKHLSNCWDVLRAPSPQRSWQRQA